MAGAGEADGEGGGSAGVRGQGVTRAVADAAVRGDRGGTEIQLLLALVQAANTAVEPAGEDALDDPGDQAREPEAITSRLLRQIVLDAPARGPPAIHIAPHGPPEPLRVRFRIPGDCTSNLSLPPALRNNLVPIIILDRRE